MSLRFFFLGFREAAAFPPSAAAAAAASALAAAFFCFFSSRRAASSAAAAGGRGTVIVAWACRKTGWCTEEAAQEAQGRQGQGRGGATVARPYG